MQDEWITSREAAAILTANSGHTVSDAYVRRLAGKGLLRTRRLHASTSLYNKTDVGHYKVAERAKKAANAA